MGYRPVVYDIKVFSYILSWGYKFHLLNFGIQNKAPTSAWMVLSTAAPRSAEGLSAGLPAGEIPAGLPAAVWAAWLVLTSTTIEGSGTTSSDFTSCDKSKWVASHEKVPYGLSRCHTKRRIGVCGRLAAPILLLVWHRLFKRAPILLLVWKRLRSLGTFSRKTAQVKNIHYSCVAIFCYFFSFLKFSYHMMQW